MRQRPSNSQRYNSPLDLRRENLSLDYSPWLSLKQVKLTEMINESAKEHELNRYQALKKLVIDGVIEEAIIQMRDPIAFETDEQKKEGVRNIVKAWKMIFKLAEDDPNDKDLKKTSDF